MIWQKWSTVVLPPARMPRFRRICYSCGADPVRGTARVRVGFLDRIDLQEGWRRAAGVEEVPMCGWCRLRPLVLGVHASMVLAVVTWFGVERGVYKNTWVAPDWSSWWSRAVRLPLAMVACLAALCVVIAPLLTLPRGVQVLLGVKGVRWSFRKRAVADAFATDNEVPIEPAAPASARGNGVDAADPAEVADGDD